ncbi:MAG: aspartate aminotransferase family protein, partial [Caldilineaceae bacterium]|nr:aspartate aminotransferase family protein [Caldilineaceae bacterium]
MDWVIAVMNRLPAGLVARVERWLQRAPGMRQVLERQYARMLAALDEEVHPYRRDHVTYARLPVRGRARDDVLAEMRALAAGETHT